MPNSKTLQRLSIYRPLRSSRISQKWGENKACLTQQGRIVSARNNVCPVNTKSYYSTVGLSGHNGIDLPCIVGEAIVHSGTFNGWMRTEVDSAGGNGIDVISSEKVFLPTEYIPTNLRGILERAEHHGVEGYLTYVKLRYWHLLTPLGWEKKEIQFGQMIGLGGNTGVSSGPHLHFGLKICSENGDSLDLWNGYYGAMNLEPFYNNFVFAGDSVRDLKIGIPALTQEEKKVIHNQLNVVKRLLLALRELLAYHV